MFMLDSVSGISPSPVFMGIKETWQLNVKEIEKKNRDILIYLNNMENL